MHRDQDPAAAERALLHAQLMAFNRLRLTPSMGETDWQAGLNAELTMRAREEQFVARELASVRAIARAAPSDGAGFVAWFESLRAWGPGQNDPLFPWLAEQASREEMIWFLRQEMAGEAGFDDLVALTQVKFPERAKLELGRNYWDELGQGHASGMHGPMLERLADELGIANDGRAVWEALALANLMVAFAVNRRYAYHSIGALGAIELTAPGRTAQVNTGLKRLGVDGEARRYYALHATLDIKHSLAWNEEVIRPIVEREPRAAQAIAEGALARLRAGARCFARYRQEFGFPAHRTCAAAE